MARRGGIGQVLAAPALAIGALAATGCASLPGGFEALPVAEAPYFSPLQFFSGRSEGCGELSKVFAGPTPVRVQSRGEIGEDGVLTLLQQVHEGDKPVRTRVWTFRETSPGRYTGTLSDASGPVEASSEGNRLTLRYPIDDGFRIVQTLTLSPDGQRAYNVLKVRGYGLTVAVLAEDIRRLE